MFYLTEILSGDPLDCSDSFKRGFRISGVYTIKPRDSDQPMNVSCHMSLVIGWLVSIKQIRINSIQYI